MPPVSRKDSSTSRSVTPTGRTAFASARRSAITGRASITAGVPVFDASPSESMAGHRGLRERPEAADEVVDVAARCAPRSVSTGVDSSASAPRRTIVGSSSSRKRGSVWMSSASASRFSAVALATSLELRIALATCARSRASGASTVSELTASCSSCVVLAGQDLEHLVGLLQRRVGAPDDLVEVLAAARHAGAELVEDQRQPLALGLAHRVADQVDVDRLHRVLDRQQVLALARAVLDLASAPAAARGWPSAAASACTRRSARRSGSAGARCSSRRGGSPGSRAR